MSHFKEGTALLKRALELEGKMKYQGALACYQEGLQFLFQYLKEVDTSKKEDVRAIIKEYMTKAEMVKLKAAEQGNKSTHEEISIENGEKGRGYESIMSNCLTPDVTWVKVDDAYIKAHHQCNNFVRFCEIVVKNCKHLRKIHLVTQLENNNEQKVCFAALQSDLSERNIHFQLEHSPTLHDRQISFSNGWNLKIGRGLDYFHPVPKYSLGYFDLDLRPCKETKIDLYYEFPEMKHA